MAKKKGGKKYHKMASIKTHLSSDAFDGRGSKHGGGHHKKGKRGSAKHR